MKSALFSPSFLLKTVKVFYTQNSGNYYSNECLFVPPHSGFAPLWEVLSEMSHQLSDIHGQFVKMLMELVKEIVEYNASQRDKLKSNVRADIH